LAGRMGQNDSSGQLHQVLEPSVADRAHAVWVLLGSAAVEYASPLPARLRRDVQDVLWMLDVAAPEVLRHRRKRGRRRVVRKRR
jgi:hypothetical protein